MSTAVYTAIFGDYDQLAHHPEIDGVDWVCFTDDERLRRRTDWDIRVRPTCGDPRRAAKRPKILGPQEDLADYDYTIWVDGSHGFRSDRFVMEALRDLGPDGIALHKHPSRGCVYDETLASLNTNRKYDGQPIVEQAEHYRAEGHPTNGGLWACGSIGRRKSERLDAAMADWWAEIERWTLQDQISFPVILARHGITPHTWPYAQYSSPWFAIGKHSDRT